MSCRTCRHYGVRPDADGKVRMRKGSVSPCLAPIPDISSLLPHSVTNAYDWKPPKAGRYMEPDDGSGCPLHAARTRTHGAKDG